MDKLERQYWEYFVKTRELSKEELEDRDLCEKLRGTFDFAICSFNVAMYNLYNGIVKALTWKKDD